MAKQETVVGVSEETKEMLEDHVKKGKPRKFFLICKGVNINALEVFKKGPFGPRIMKAKKDGLKGEVTYGIVTGSGKELYFQLAGNQAVAEIMKVDGFHEEPPTKKAKLRDFLADNDLSFKPKFFIITSPTDAPDPDSESSRGAPPSSYEAKDGSGGEVATETETSEGEDEESKTVTPPSDTSLFTERLKALKPDIDRVVAAGGPVGEEVKLRVSEAAMFARKKEFDQANGLLDRVEELLKQSVPPVPPPPPKVDLSGLFNKRLAGIVAQVKEAAGTRQGNEAKLKLSEAGVFARNKDFETANALLDDAEAILAESEQDESEGEESGGGGPSVVKFAKLRLEWESTKQEVASQLDDLGHAIVDEYDDDEAWDGAAKVQWILERFDEGLGDKLDEIYNAEQADKRSLAQDAYEICNNYIDFMEKNDLVAHIESNPYMNVTIRSLIVDKLNEIRDELEKFA